MTDTRETLVIDVSLGDEVTKVIPGISAAIKSMADKATEALKVPGQALEGSLKDALGGLSLGSAPAIQELKQQFEAARGSVDRLRASVVELRDIQDAAARNGALAVDVYIDALKRQSAALTLTNQERQEAAALLVAEKVASEQGGTPSDAQRQAIVAEMRAREELVAQREQEAAEIVRSQRLNAQAVAEERAGRFEVSRSLREAIQLREREAETIRRGFETSQLARSQELNRGAVTQVENSRAQEIKELREAILARSAEAEVLRKNRVALDQYMGGLRDERVLLQLDVRQREVVIAQRRAEDLAIKAGITDRQRLLQLVRQEVQETQKARAAALGGAGGQGAGISSVLSALPLGGAAGQLQGFVLQARAGAAALGQVGVAAGASSVALGPLAIAVGVVGAGFVAMAKGASLVKQAVEDSLALSNALKPIAVQSEQGAAGLAALKSEIVGIARETGRSQAEIAAASKLVAPLGDYRQQADQLREFARLAKASIVDVGVAGKAVDSVLDAFGERADMTRLRAAQLFVAMRAGESDIASFGAATAEVGPVATRLGVSFEDVVKTLAVMTARTGDAGKAANALKKLLSDLRDPGSQLSTEFRRIGVDAQSAAFKQRDLATVIADVQQLVDSRPGLDVQLFGDGRTAAATFAAIQGIGSQAIKIIDDQVGAVRELDASMERLTTTTDAWGRVLEKLKDRAGLNDIGAGIDSALGSIGKFLDSQLGEKAGSGAVADLLLAPFGALGTALQFARREGVKLAEESRLASEQILAKQKQAREDAKADAAAQAQVQADAVRLTLRFSVDEAESRRAVEDAFRRLGTIAPDERRDLPVNVERARLELTNPLLPKEDQDVALRVLTAYFAKVDEGAALMRRLRVETSSGLQQEIERRKQATGTIRETIDELERQGLKVGELRKLFAQYSAEQTSEAVIQQNRVLAGLQADQLAATVEALKASEAHARAVGNVALAETVAAAIRRESETVELRRLQVQEEAALAAQKNNSIEQESIRARFEALRRALAIQRDTTEEVRRRAQIERTAETQRAISGIRASLGVGLSGEIERIRQAGEAERAAARSALEALRASASGTSEDIQNKVAETAALVESSFLRQRRAESELRESASAEIASTILGIQEQTARTYEEQRVILGEIAREEESRLVKSLTAKGASEDEIQRLRELLGLKREQAELELEIRESEPSAVDKAREGLKGQFSGSEAFNTGLRAGIEDMRKLFADDFTQGVKLAQDALRTFRDSGVSNMEDVLDGTKSLSEGLEGIAADFLKSIRRNLLEGLFNQLGGGLSGLFGGLFGGPGAGLSGIGVRAQGGVEHGQLRPVYQAAQGMVARSRTLLDVAEIPGLQELIAPLDRGRLPVHVDEHGGMRVRVRGAEVPVDLQGAGTKRRADAAVFAGGARERSSTDTRAATRGERVGGSQVTIAPGAFVMQGHSFTINVQAKGGAQAAQDVASQMPMITKAIAADIERGTTRALRDAIRAAAR